MKNFIPVIIIITIVFSCNTHKNFENIPVQLTCESDTNTMGIEIPNPAFGWQLSDTSNGVVQGAYQILVASNENLLDEQKADLWNSGKIVSGNSQFVFYSGKPLEPMKQYFWKVQVWDTTGKLSGYSKPSWFETGLMNSKWKASWIKPSENLKENYSVLYRHEFSTNKKINKATVYASGVGSYVIYINGKRLRTEHLAPGYTVFDKQVLYQIYDATSYLNEAENAIGSIVSNFWNNLENSNLAASLQFIMQMKIEYTDGSISWICTDKSWKSGISPVVKCDYDNGEIFNATLYSENWCKPKFNDKKWLPVSISKNKIKLTHSFLKPIEVMENISPLKILKKDGNIYLFDFGQEMCGWISLQEKFKKGTEIKIKYISENQINTIKDFATDEFISDGKLSIWEPEFAYHKFRYVEISGLDSKPSEKTIIAKLAYPAINVTGQFSCSNKFLNKINEVIEHTGRNNLATMLTSLPETTSRTASPVNAQAYAAYALYHYKMGIAFEKYTNDLKDLQGKSGRLNLLQNNAKCTNSPGWGEVILVVPWKTYLFTGDRRVLEINYLAMKAWHSSQQHESDAQSPPYMHNVEGLGDLFALDSTSTKPIGSAYYYYASTLMNKITDAMGNPDDATSYMELAGFTKDQYNQSYLTYHTSRYWAKTETAHIIPMAVGLTPLSYVQKITRFIASDIHKRNDHSSTGVLSTQFLLPLLSENDENELAYKLISQTTKPSLGYEVKNGATEIWGSWDKNIDSPYQLAFASEGEWLYAYLVGINPDAKYPGFKHNIIQPNPVKDLKWAEASINTEYGLLKVKWEKLAEVLTLSIIIPANTSSTILIPVENSKTADIIFNNFEIVKKGKKTSQCPSYIKFRGFNAKMAVFEVGSGKYKFIAK